MIHVINIWIRFFCNVVGTHMCCNVRVRTDIEQHLNDVKGACAIVNVVSLGSVISVGHKTATSL